MSTSQFEESLKSCIEKDKYIIQKLKELIDEVETHHTICNSVKTGGTAVGAVGTGLMVASLIAAPFTAGASLAVTAAAAACSVGGAATNIITNAVDRSKTKDIIADVQNIVQSRDKIMSQFKEQTDQFNKLVKSLVSNGLNDQDATQITFHAIANGSIDLTKAAKNNDVIRDMVGIGMGIGRLVQTELHILSTVSFMSGPSVLLLTTSAFAISPLAKSLISIFNELEQVGKAGGGALKFGQAFKVGGDALKAGQAFKAGGDALKAGQAFKAGGDALKAGQALKAGGDIAKAGQAVKAGGQALEAGQATFSVVKSVSAVAVAATVASVAFTVVDVAFLISDWVSDHPTIAVINNVIKQLNEELERFKDLHSTIDTFKEKAYLSTIDDMPIISSSTIFNDALIALLNNDVAECIKILKEHEIDWPFNKHYNQKQLAQLITENDIASGYDKKEVENVIEKTGKKAKKAILTLVTKIVDVLKKKKDNATKDKSNDKRHARGEHVINNSVLRLHRDIIDLFLQYQFNTTFEVVITRVGRDSHLYRDYHQPLPDNIRENIQTRMVAHIPDDYQYFDGNALLYGILIRILREFAKLHMSDLYNDLLAGHAQLAGGTRHTGSIRLTVSQLNFLQAYVDHVAKTYWLTHQGGDWATYERSRTAVEAMFQNLYDKIRDWVLELRRAGY